MSTQACRIADADIWYNPVIIRILGHLPNFDSDISSFVEAQSHNLGMSWAGETEELLGILAFARQPRRAVIMISMAFSSEDDTFLVGTTNKAHW